MQTETIAKTIGNTPLVELKGFAARHALKAQIYAKLEYFNPAGSVKDRIALAMIEDAEKSGRLKKGASVIEPTSGNTGIGIAAIGAAKGYHVCIVMPETMSEERRRLVKAYGAELVLTPGKEGMRGAIGRADALAAERPGSVVLGQFTNPANPRAHYLTTGPEIWRDTAGRVDILVAGVGTGGTVTGAGRFLKEKNPAVRVVAVEPAGSPVLTKGIAGSHKIQGIGAGFVPAVFDPSVCDEVIDVSDEDAFQYAREVGREGFLAGISSGAALCAAAQLAARPEHAGKNIVVIFPDGGDRYLSTALFSEN